jgi:hypothetical protein
VALPYARLVDPLPVQSPGNIQGVLDLPMDLTHQSVPTLGRPTPRLPSNENRSASLGHRPAYVLVCCNTVWQHQ